MKLKFVVGLVLESFSTDGEADYECEIWKQVLRSMRNLKSRTVDS